MKRNLLTLTALLLANAVSIRGEGENDPPRLTEEEWKQKRAAALADKNQSELVQAVVAAEVENRTLKKTQVPNGARVLTEEEAKAYDAYVALGKPDEVKTKLDQGTKDTEELTSLRFKDGVNTAARDAGFKPTVLGDRIKADGLTVVPSREVERDGKKVQVAYVKDAQGTEHELAAYAKQHWNDYLPALQASASADGSGASYARQDAGGSSGDQQGGSSGGSGWLTDALKSTSGGAYVDPLQPQAASAPK